MRVVEVIVDAEYDTGYGEVGAELVADVAIYETGAAKVLSGTYFLIDQDGGTFGEREYEDGSYDELLIEKATANKGVK